MSGGTGTLTNGPTYSTDGGGSIVFDGTNDYVDCGSGSSLNLRFFTLDCWVNPSIVSGGNGTHRHLIGYELCYKVRFNGDSVQVLLGNGTTWHTYIDTNFGIINANSWYNVTVNVTPLNICNIYINGVLTKTQNTSDIGNNGRKLFIGAYDAGGGTPFGFFNGKMSSSSIYNRALTQSEILQNYQAQFPQILGENIITNGLVLYLDAGYRTSYPTTGTTWNNVSGISGGTGTLTNGPTYDSANGGSIVFDGIDDYIYNGNIPLSSNTFTIEIVFSWDGYNTDGLDFLTAGVDEQLEIHTGGASGVNGLRFIPYDFQGSGKQGSIDANNIISSGINHITFTAGYTSLSTVYKNGIFFKSSDTASTTPLNLNQTFNIGRRQSNQYFLDGKVYLVKIYNRVLNEYEVLQNFNATKSRFGL